jgi:hypothetical protein
MLRAGISTDNARACYPGTHTSSASSASTNSSSWYYPNTNAWTTAVRLQSHHDSRRFSALVNLQGHEVLGAQG